MLNDAFCNWSLSVDHRFCGAAGDGGVQQHTAGGEDVGIDGLQDFQLHIAIDAQIEGARSHEWTRYRSARELVDGPVIAALRMVIRPRSSAATMGP